MATQPYMRYEDLPINTHNMQLSPITDCFFGVPTLKPGRDLISCWASSTTRPSNRDETLERWMDWPDWMDVAAKEKKKKKKKSTRSKLIGP